MTMFFRLEKAKQKEYFPRTFFKQGPEGLSEMMCHHQNDMSVNKMSRGLGMPPVRPLSCFPADVLQTGRTGMELLCPSAWWGVNEAGLICSPDSQGTHYGPCQIQWAVCWVVSYTGSTALNTVIQQMAEDYCSPEIV